MVRASARAATVQYSAVLRCGTVQYSTVLNSVPIPADPANNYALPAIVYADYLLPVFYYLVAATYFPDTTLPVSDRTGNEQAPILPASSLLKIMEATTAPN